MEIDSGILRDAALVLVLVGYIWRASAAQTNMRRDIRENRKDIDRHKDEHSDEASENKEFRAKVYDFMDDTRNRLTRIEARGNGG